MNKMLQIEDLLDVINEGIIEVDTEGKVEVYNQKAMQMTGLYRKCHKAHPAGRIQNGDLVILAQTSFGEDDGGLNIEDLACIGLPEFNIEKGDAVIAAGIYGQTQATYKVKPAIELSESLEMNGVLSETLYKAKIDFLNKQITIEISGTAYTIDYNNQFSHMVVYRKSEAHAIFYETSGYTAWREEVKGILKGAPFYEKKVGDNFLSPLGKPLTAFHDKGKVTEKLLACAQGLYDGSDYRYGLVNGISVLYAVIPIDRSGQRVGAVLLLTDIKIQKFVENQRNIMMEKLKKVSEDQEDPKMLEKMFPKYIGKSEEVLSVKTMAYRAVKSKSTVLILGESGTGKSILARAIHDAQGKYTKPFIHVNCTAIPETLLESEFFGYERGAFTGANAKGKKGFFEMADGGTIFLDEIGDISHNMQIKLLQVLQNRTFFRVGGSKEIKVDVRIIVATNKDLEFEVEEGRFRQDLYYRINVFPIHVPPLRERLEDIDVLCKYLLPKVCERVGTPIKRLHSNTRQKMKLYTWPGNIRELENVLERAVNLCEGEVIKMHHINIQVDQPVEDYPINYMRPLKETVREVEKEAIQYVLEKVDYNKADAMKILEIKKTQLYDKLKKYDFPK